jgi:hypothetical protein
LVAFKKRFAPPVPAGPADDPAHAPPYPEHQDLARRVEQGTP